MKQMNTLEEVLDYIIHNTPEDAKEQLKARYAAGESIETIAGSAHFGGGMALRNSLNLWSPESAALRQDIWNYLSPTKQEFYATWWKKCAQDFTGANMHADDASATILEAAVEKIVKG